jgi:hypothetical protein
LDAVSDYLRWIWGRVQEKIKEDTDDDRIFDRASTTVVMTVPASWSDEAKDNTVQAAERAGIPEPGSVELNFITEPESAAISELQKKNMHGLVSKGDCFILCDAGGGTVDVVTYEVQLENPMVLNQRCVAEGDLCGSVFIDIEFQNQLRSFLQDDMDRLSASALADIADRFEYKIKRSYLPDLKEPRKYLLPVPGIDDDPVRNIKANMLELDP